MADIDEIISGARGNTRVDPANLDLVGAFFNASKQRAEFDQRRAFRDGVPTGEDGQPDFAAMSKVLFQKGDVGQGIATSNLDIQRQQLKAGQELSAKIGQMEGGGVVSPPSTSRNASTPVAKPIAQGQTPGRQGQEATGREPAARR